MSLPAESIRAYIEEHFARIDGPDEIAEVFGVPLETLRRAFRREVGMPPGDYLRRVRVRRAQQLLAETGLRAAEVCYAVGWKREDTGERTFRHETGQTMQGYRRSVRNMM